MSGSAAISRAKARRGMGENQAQMSQSAAETFGKMEKEEKNPEQLLIQHDYKLYIFEKRIRELYEMITTKNDNGIPDTVNENMLSEALASLDNRLENLESNATSNNSNKQIEKLEQEQKELKNLLIKIQNMTMETNLKVMQIKENRPTNTTVESVDSLTSETLDLSLNEENKEGKKKNRK
mgnify:CR=1 FL=1